MAAQTRRRLRAVAKAACVALCLSTPIPELAKLLGLGSWIILRKICLGSMIVHKDELFSFFFKHSTPLRSLLICVVGVYAGYKGE